MNRSTNKDMTFHKIQIPVGVSIPQEMNDPFDYAPHPLCRQVCAELQKHLSQRTDWHEEISKGKMFGILLVKKDTEVGYLVAYSGQIQGRSDWEGFVPAVFDYLQPDGYFKVHEAEITQINDSIARLEEAPFLEEARRQIEALRQSREQVVLNYRKQMNEAKDKRDARRREGQLSQEEEQLMIRESQFMKAELRRLKKGISEPTLLEKEYTEYLEDIQHLKQTRKQLSDALQRWLFSQFRMLNPRGEEKDLLEIFRDMALNDTVISSHLSRRLAYKMIPPAGSGECCEPKLLQYAYRHGFRPLQMAMFWWGESPREEIRHHLHFYPACNGKCKPILQWMLPDVAAIKKKKRTEERVEILFEDHEIVVINKPSGMLSVPGKSDESSVYSIMHQRYPDATGPLIVHRLDMATSGLMVIAKTEFAYHQLQKQFVTHHVRKKYIAILCGSNIPPAGILSLPLSPDYLDRPRQVVDFLHGKEAITEYQVLEEKCGKVRICLTPLTGRTHQLRVHCAHKEGLHAPILGDPLYGNEEADRLYLHAEYIRFIHPLTGKAMYFERKADF